MGDSSLGHPLRTDHLGRLALVTGHHAVESRFVGVLGTIAGERVMHPDIGIQLDWRREELGERIGDLLQRTEPGIEIESVVIDDRPSRLWLRPSLGVTVDYRLLDSGERHRFEGDVEWIS